MKQKVLFCSFLACKFQSKGNNSCINKDTCTGIYHNIQYDKNEVRVQAISPSQIEFSNYCTMNHFYIGVPIQINSKTEIRRSNPCQSIKYFIELSLYLVFKVKVFGQNSLELIDNQWS